MSEPLDTIVAFTRLERSFHNHLLHFMIFFIITGLPLLSTSFSFLGWLFAIPYDFFRSPYLDLATSGLTDNERLAVGLQVARDHPSSHRPVLYHHGHPFCGGAAHADPELVYLAGGQVEPGRLH